MDISMEYIQNTLLKICNAPHDRDRYPAAVWLKKIAYERAFSDYYIRQYKVFRHHFTVQ